MCHKGYNSTRENLFFHNLLDDILENEKGVNGNVKVRIIYKL